HLQVPSTAMTSTLTRLPSRLSLPRKSSIFRTFSTSSQTTMTVPSTKQSNLPREQFQQHSRKSSGSLSTASCPQSRRSSIARPRSSQYTDPTGGKSSDQLITKSSHKEVSFSHSLPLQAQPRAHPPRRRTNSDGPEAIEETHCLLERIAERSQKGLFDATSDDSSASSTLADTQPQGLLKRFTSIQEEGNHANGDDFLNVVEIIEDDSGYFNERCHVSGSGTQVKEEEQKDIHNEKKRNISTKMKDFTHFFQTITTENYGRFNKLKKSEQ
ncbi:hypothetical protein SK128_011117, partial [Halocaridina rubra]